jgi:ABC-type phosphate transport system, periplasmic component
MIKIIAFSILSFLIMLCIIGCDNTDGVTNDSNETTAKADTETTAETAADSAHAAELAKLLAKNFPSTDGSTSAIPLDAAVRAAIFGISYDDAEAQTSHTTSYDSFNRLLNKEVDLVFCHLLSQEQYDTANSMSVTVEQTAIAREGFVFLVSKDNPIDSLTVDQLKKIYSGEITNWKQVGGDDTPIIAYQRNSDSGSQNYMTEFMGDTPLTDAPTELRPGSMDTLVDAVAAYSTSGGSIGYSVYSYVGGMYNADGGVKILQVNGVAPDYSTIADGTYPCTGYNYVVIRSDEADGSPARLLVEWLTTSAGQAAIATTGYYAPLEPTSNVTPSITGINLYTQTGTGNTAFNGCAWYYTAEVPTAVLDIGHEDGYAVGVRKYNFDRRRPITGNETLDAEIEKYLIDTTEQLTKLTLDSDITEWDSEPTLSIQFTFTALNGYLSIEINRNYSYYIGSVWDIETGKRLSLSDLFSDGTAFAAKLNADIQYSIDIPDIYSGTIETIRPFAGIESGFNNFAFSETYSEPLDDLKVMHLNLYFNPGDNSYFNTTHVFGCSVRELDGCLLLNTRDMSSDFTGQYREYWAHEDVTLRSESPASGDNYTAELRWYDISGYDGADKINTAQYDYLKANYDPAQLAWSDNAVSMALVDMADIIKANYGIDNPTRADLKQCRVIIEADQCFLGNSYVAVSYYARAQYDDAIGYGGGVVSGRHLAIYDLNSGEEVNINVLMKTNKIDGDWYICDKSTNICSKTTKPVVDLVPTALYGGAWIWLGENNNPTQTYEYLIFYFGDDDTSGIRVVPADDLINWFN